MNDLAIKVLLAISLLSAQSTKEELFLFNQFVCQEHLHQQGHWYDLCQIGWLLPLSPLWPPTRIRIFLKYSG